MEMAAVTSKPVVTTNINNERRLRIVLVEDTDYVLEMVSIALKKAGFEVRCARTGRRMLKVITPEASEAGVEIVLELTIAPFFSTLTM